MATRAALLIVVGLSGCVTGVTDDDAPDFDLDGETGDAQAESGDGKADGAARQTVFLNFGGARIRGGDCSDAPGNCSSLVAGEQEFGPFAVSDEWDRAKVVAGVTRCVGMFFDDMSVRFVTTRPASGPYTMMVIGPVYPTQLGFPDDSGGPYGRAPVDCGNANKNDVGFLLLKDDVNPDFYYMCRSIAHEVAHTFGMVHTGGENTVVGERVDVMCETNECREAAATGRAKWDTINRAMPSDVAACKGGDRQNTYGDLITVLGVARP